MIMHMTPFRSLSEYAALVLSLPIRDRARAMRTARRARRARGSSEWRGGLVRFGVGFWVGLRVGLRARDFPTGGAPDPPNY